MTPPGPDHPIDIARAGTRMRAMFMGHVIADTDDALILKEADLPPVVYFPKEDVSMEYFSRTERLTHCPYKGEAAYYTLLMNGEFAENAVWTYEEPYPAMERIRGRLAFYPDKVEVYAVTDQPARDASDRREVDEIIQHTDAGDGTTQKPHWPPNVGSPDA